MDTAADIEPEFVRARPVFQLLGVSDRAGYLAIRERRFPLEHVQIGGVIKFRRRDVERFLTGDTAPD